MSQIRVHVSAPDEIVIPDTGTMTRPTPDYSGGGVNNTYYTGLGIVVAIVLVILLPAFLVKRWKKQGHSKGKMAIRIMMLAILSFGLTYAALSFSENSTVNTRAVDQTENGLTATATDVDIYVELSDEPVFASGSGTITVDESTEGGYILRAYGSSDLVSTTDANNKIAGLTSSNTVTLSDDTWGLSLVAAESQDDSTWQALPTTEPTALTIKSTTAHTAENDQTTVYYGVYISPATEPGTYVGTINYVATANLVMQNVSEWGSSVTEGQEVIAVDKRDGKTYIVSRMEDGRLWMLQNLDHDIDSAKTYTSADTDLLSGTTWTPSRSTNAAGSNIWESSYYIPESLDADNKYWNGITQDGSGDLEDFITDSGDAKYHLGNYYNWTAAVAMNDSSAYTKRGTLIDQSICPSGWTLPRSGDVLGSFYKLISLYDTYDSTTRKLVNGTELWNAPTYFALTGRGLYGHVGNYGGFWSSSVNSGGNAYNMYLFSNGRINVGFDFANRAYGNSVRCIARPTIENLTYMQDFSTLSDGDKASVLASMTEEEQYYLKDSRDNKTYRIAKLKDGNVWMTQTLALNLDDFIGTHNLTVANTDLVSDTAKARGYWDPSESVQDRITLYSDELDARGLTHDFTGLSTLIIGQTQPQQYLSTEQTGYTWGSHIKDDGTFEPYAHNSNSNSNSYTDIPRSYSGEKTISYNWYAATAESGTRTMTSGDAEDSICPAGWQIPYGNEENHSWYNLFINAYGLSTNGEENATAVRNAPFYLLFEGGLNWDSGKQNTSGTDGYYHTTTARTNAVMFAVVHNTQTWVGTYGNGGKVGGAAIRCVTR